jgi:ParB family transcriptional regulator, chromosome partitioning protein
MSTKKPIARLNSGAPRPVMPPAIQIGPNTDTASMQKALSEQAPPRSPTSDSNLDRFQPLHRVSESLDVNLLQIGKTYEIPVALVSGTENNARVFYKPDEVEQMGMGLTKDGQKVPAIGYVKDGQVKLMDGQKRFNACLLYKIATIKVQIEPPPASDIEEYETSRLINSDRSTQTVFDDAVRWADFLQTGQYSSQEEICARLKLNKSTVSKTLGLNRIPNALKRQMLEFENTSSLSVAYEVSTIFSNATEENIQKKSLSYLKAMELVKSKLNGPKSRIRGQSAPIKFGDYKGTIMTVPEKGAFTMSFTGLTGDDLQKLQTMATTIFSGQS